jgi:hypothetical protein
MFRTKGDSTGIAALAGHADRDPAEAEPATEEGADAGDDGRLGSGRVAAGEQGEHGEQEVPAPRKVLRRCWRQREGLGRTAMKGSVARVSGDPASRRSARRSSSTRR